MKTILITGCSSGFGLEIAKHFLERDWKVVATMRTPRKEVVPESANMRVLPLDVTDRGSIDQAISEAGPIDVLVNNAGIGAAVPFEMMALDMVRQLFETNTFGTMAVTQAVIPQMRERKSGVIVNVTSSVTLKALPIVSAYTATKAAVNQWSESLAIELQPFGVRVHTVLPGRAPETSFAENGHDRMAGLDHPAYGDIVKQMFGSFTEDGPVTRSIDVAEAVWQVANDPNSPIRLPAGEDAREWASAVK